jgi:energy-coupling factor transport system ATP-binding protein
MITFDHVISRGLEIPDLALPPGRTAVIGPNGGGKTRFLRLIAGLDSPREGIVAVDGRSPRECEVGWVDEFPDRNMLFSRVDEEIAGPLRFRHTNCPEIRSRVSGIASEVGILHLAERETLHLSGGEKALVALAAAFACTPDILVLDEFDSHLDREASKQVQDMLGNRRFRYVVWCTQDMESAREADMVAYLEKGRIARSGSPRDVFSGLKNSCFYPLSWKVHNAASP